MAITINVVGQGQVQTTSQLVNEQYWAPGTSSTRPYGRVYGYGYQYTAVPDAQWAFDHWEVSWTATYQDSTDGGQTWYTYPTKTGSLTDSVNPLGYPAFDYNACYNYAAYGTSTTPTSYPPIWTDASSAYIAYITYYNGGYNMVNRVKYSNITVTAHFKKSHIPTHLIIRDNTTGKIMRGGLNNKILRDD